MRCISHSIQRKLLGRDRARHRLSASRATLLGGVVAFMGLCIGMPAEALACSGGGSHYYGSDTSGSDSNTGTAATTNVWSSIYVTYPNGFSDEAVWTGEGNYSHSIEGGFYSGVGNNIAWTNENLPYHTVSNGNQEFDDGSHALADGVGLTMAVQPAISGNAANYSISYNGSSSAYYSLGNYNVPTPRQNYFQGETVSNCGTPTATWMGGGTGEWFDLYSQPASDYPFGYVTWAFQSPHADSPYWQHTRGNYAFENGGK